MKFTSTHILLLIACLFLIACNSTEEKATSEHNPLIERDINFLKDKDIDGDDIPDQILFEYSGGAHCCYDLTLILSSDSVQYDFPFNMDGGYVYGEPDNSQPQHFNIVDYDNDGRYEIYIQIETYNADLNPLPADWTHLYGITSHQIVIDFKDSLRILNIPPFISIEQFYLQKNNTSNSSEMIEYKKGDEYYGCKYGFKNEEGETMILPILSSTTPFSNEVAIVTLNQRTILINRRGEIISSFDDYHLIDDHVNSGFPILVTDETITDFYYIDNEGDLLNENPYLDAKSFSEGVATVQVPDGTWGYIDVHNSWFIEPQFKHAHPFENEKAFIELKDTMLWIDKNGNPID